MCLHGFATAFLALAGCAISGHLHFIVVWSTDNFKEANINVRNAKDEYMQQ